MSMKGLNPTPSKLDGSARLPKRVVPKVQIVGLGSSSAVKKGSGVSGDATKGLGVKTSRGWHK